MARRSSLTSEDLMVIESTLNSAISSALREEQSGETSIASIAPLFAVREKIIAMKAKGNGSTDTPKVRKTRTPRTNLERTEA